jgi:chromate reductase
MSQTRIAVIVGSLRKDSYNQKLALALAHLAPSDFTFEHLRIDDLPLYNQDDDGNQAPSVKRLKTEIAAAQGLLFVTPEYNRSIPGGLKNAIDWVSRLQNQPFAGKPVALQSASPGPVGGARVQYDMRKAMTFLDAHTLNKPEIFIGNCASKLDEATGEIKDETTRGFIKQQLASFVTYIARVSPKN